MVDSITLEKSFEARKELYNANGRPFDFNGLTYSPKYLHGDLQRYEAENRNLRLYMYPEKIYLCNSLHKYWHGNNYNDFYLPEIKDAFERLNNETGINWNEARITKIEIGCNIQANASGIVSSLLSYKGKDFLPMHHKGKQYGAVCEFTDYKIKGYDKAFEVKQSTHRDLKFPLLRWEIPYARVRSIERIIQCQLTVNNLLKPKTLQIMAKDAVSKYQNTLKMQQLNLCDLTTHEQRVLAEMLYPPIRENLKRYHKETYKRDRRIYRSMMANKTICINDNTGELIEQKFKELIQGIKAREESIIEKHHCKLVV